MRILLFPTWLFSKLSVSLGLVLFLGSPIFCLAGDLTEKPAKPASTLDLGGTQLGAKKSLAAFGKSLAHA